MIEASLKYLNNQIPERLNVPTYNCNITYTIKYRRKGGCMISRERVEWIKKNFVKEEVDKGRRAILTLLHLELDFTPDEEDNLTQALKEME